MAVTGTKAEDADCPICGNPVQYGKKKPQLLYEHQVCYKCYYGFAGLRQAAFVVDYSLYCLLAFLAQTTLGADTAQGPILWLSVGLLVKDGFSGRSPGKALTGLRVVKRDSGCPAGLWASFLRNLPLCIPFVVLAVAFELKQGCRTGDRWSGTKVVWGKYKDKVPFALAEEVLEHRAA